MGALDRDETTPITGIVRTLAEDELLAQAAKGRGALRDRRRMRKRARRLFYFNVAPGATTQPSWTRVHRFPLMITALGSSEVTGKLVRTKVSAEL